MKKFILASLALAMASGLSACEWVTYDSTVTSVVDSDYYPHGPYRPYDPYSPYEPIHHGGGVYVPPSRPPGTYVPPGHIGSGSPSCTMVRDSSGRIRSTCPGRGYAASLSVSSDAIAVSHIANKYSLPMESAEKFNAILVSSASGKSSIMAGLGLSERDMTGVALGQLPSESALDQVAANLAMNRTMARELVQKLMDETTAQMADVNSPAWTACMSTGSWKTNANGGTCKQTYWSGCSPSTGASVCAAIR